MIELDFSIKSSIPKEIDPARVGEMTAALIQESVLVGDLIVSFDGIDCSARWGWIPILDCAVCLSAIAVELARSPRAIERFEFTENEASILFARNGDAVRIAPTYVPLSALVPLNELESAIRSFRERAFASAVTALPGLEQCAGFLELRGHA